VAVLLLLATALGSGLLAGLLLRGRFSGLAELRLRWTPVLVLSLLVSLVPLFVDLSGTGLPKTFLIASNIGVLIFLASNIVFADGGVRTGFLVAGAGWAMNFLAIAANGGMPLSRWALEHSGQSGEITAGKGGFFKVVEATPDSSFRFFGDVIPIRAFSQVVSLGDIVLMVGIAIIIASGMRRRRERVAEPVV
jgi:hypothetical protein